LWGSYAPAGQKGLCRVKKGSHHSEETKEKMREAKLGKPPSPETRENMRQSNLGEKNPFFGKHHTPEAIERIRQARLGKPSGMLGKQHTPAAIEKIRQANLGRHHTPATIEKISGEKGYNWRGGISFEEYSTAWTEALKESIRKRDKYSCQLCGKKQEDLLEKLQKKLAVHHIDYDKKNLNTENLISLCRSCHGKTNYKREEWKIVFCTKRKAGVEI